MSTHREVWQDDVTGAIYPPTAPDSATQEVDYHLQRLNEALMEVATFIDEQAERSDKLASEVRDTNMRGHVLRAITSAAWIRRSNTELAEWVRQQAAQDA